MMPSATRGLVAAVVLVAIACGPPPAGEAPSPATPPPTRPAPARPPVARPTPTALPEPDARRRLSPDLDVAITISTYGSMEAVTRTGATCTARAALADGAPIAVSGLQATVIAGTDGHVAWRYDRVVTATPGVGAHTVSCVLGGRSATATASFSVP